MSTNNIFVVLSITISLLGFPCRDGFAKVYPVGPGQPYVHIGDVPWESLNAGDSVLIHFRDSSYHEKWVICRSSTGGTRQPGQSSIIGTKSGQGL